MSKYQIRRCRAHSAGICWLVRRWQEATSSYVHQSAHDSFDNAIGAIR